MRLYGELCRILREVRKCLRQERRRRKNQEDDDAAERRARDARRLTPEPAERATGSAQRMPRRDTEDTAADVESAMAGAFADSAGMPKASAIREVTAAVGLQTGAAIEELDLVEQELRKSGHLPSDDAK